MDKLIEIDGRWIQIKSKTIEINGEEVMTQGDIKILDAIKFEDVKQTSNDIANFSKPVQLAANKYQPTNDFFEQREA